MLSTISPQPQALEPPGLDMLSKADSLPPLAELWDVFHGSVAVGHDIVGAAEEDLLEPAAKAARQTEADAFFNECFPWLADDAMLDPAQDQLTHSVSSGSDSPMPAEMPSPQQVHTHVSHSSTASASTSEVRLPQPCSSTGTPGNSTAMCLGDYVKQEEAAQQRAGSGTMLPYDLAASAAAAAAKAMAATSMVAPMQQASVPAANNVVVEGSTASLVTWGPPEFQQSRPMPPPVVTVPQSAFAGTAGGLAGSMLIPTPTSAAPSSSSQLHAGNSFRRSNTGGPVPATAGSGTISSPFLPPTLSAPALSQILYDDSMIDQSLRLPGSSLARLSKRPSGGSSGTGTAGAPAATAGSALPGAPSNTGKAAGGGRGGRRPSAATTGRPATGVIKDTTRRKAAEIARLEEEVAQKLKVVSDLEKEREELERRERLLKLQVSAGERHLFCQSINGITPHLKTLIQGFRTSFNQMLANDLLAQMPEDPKKFTIKEMMVTWQSFVHEIAGLMMEDPNHFNTCQDVCERIGNFCMSVCIHAPNVILKAASTNMQTGEEEVPPMELWEEVVSKLELSEQQAADLRSIYNLYSSMLQQATAEFHGLVVSLSKLIEQDLVRGNVLNIKVCSPLLMEATVQKEQVFKQLETCSRRGHMLHTMLSFMVMATLEPRQRAVMTFSAFPAFPNLKMIVAVVHKSFADAAGAQGPPAASPSPR